MAYRLMRQDGRFITIRAEVLKAFERCVGRRPWAVVWALAIASRVNSRWPSA